MKIQINNESILAKDLPSIIAESIFWNENSPFWIDNIKHKTQKSGENMSA